MTRADRLDTLRAIPHVVGYHLSADEIAAIEWAVERAEQARIYEEALQRMLAMRRGAYYGQDIYRFKEAARAALAEPVEEEDDLQGIKDGEVLPKGIGSP